MRRSSRSRPPGPTTLSVEGDAIKVRRIAQNLLLNALKYTRAGSVVLAWGEAAPGDSRRWSLSVQDSGPGFHCRPGRADRQFAQSGGRRRAESTPGARCRPSPRRATTTTRPIHQSQGEGLGLAIVKRLCDLLDAVVEFETEVEKGTTVRVLLPRRYASPPA